MMALRLNHHTCTTVLLFWFIALVLQKDHGIMVHGFHWQQQSTTLPRTRIRIAYDDRTINNDHHHYYYPQPCSYYETRRRQHLVAAAATSSSSSSSASSGSASTTTTAVVVNPVSQEGTTTTTTTATASADSIKVIPPGGSFRDTVVGQQVSVVSMNLLASYYHFLGTRNNNHQDENDNDESTRIQQQQEQEQQDRIRRTPLSIDLAKQTNADILLLQEVEGGEGGHYYEDLLRTCLAKPFTITQNKDGSMTRGQQQQQQGYDAFIWSALYPHRTKNTTDPVGLAVAWRSTRHRLVSCESFRRGMVVQLEEIQTGATLILANLHLFAKPSAIEGRLKTMALTMRRIQELEQNHQHQQQSKHHHRHRMFSSTSPLDGTIVVAGDFNCDHPSVTTRLLTTGSVPFGKLKDRNYQAKITKSTAARMKQPFRFQTIYDDQNNNANLRRTAAPVTVSLKGRGPGCLDHMFFVSGRNAKDIQRRGGGGTRKITHAHHHHDHLSRFSRTSSAGSAMQDLLLNNSGKRSIRRIRAQQRASQWASRNQNHDGVSQYYPVTVQAVLATVDATNATRTQIIMNGLPNEAEGFPSDHLPIGAMFGPDSLYVAATTTTTTTTDTFLSSSSSPPPPPSSFFAPGHKQHLSSNAVRRRRQAHAISTMIRRRHNTILRVIADWLLQTCHATDMIRDQPLYKWKYTEGVHGLHQKMRAPDLCCILGHKDDGDDDNSNNNNNKNETKKKKKTLVIVEVSVVGARPDETRADKLHKYRDLAGLLRTSKHVSDANLAVANVFALVFSEDGSIPAATRNDLRSLRALATPGDDAGRNDTTKDNDNFDASLTTTSLEDRLSEILVDFAQ